MEYENIDVYGILRAQGEKYWLVHPQPIELDIWQRDNERAFLVVPFLEHLSLSGSNEGYKYWESCGGVIYPYPRRVIVSGDYSLERLHDITIKVKKEFKVEHVDERGEMGEWLEINDYVGYFERN